jgi:hypothetical protein
MINLISPDEHFIGRSETDIERPDNMVRSDKARAVRTGTAQADGLISWSDQRVAAYQAARREIEQLQPGQAIVYHEGYLAIDATHDAAVAGRAGAFLEAGTELGEGVLGQRWVRSDWYQYIFWKSRR